MCIPPFGCMYCLSIQVIHPQHRCVGHIIAQFSSQDKLEEPRKASFLLGLAAEICPADSAGIDFVLRQALRR